MPQPPLSPSVMLATSMHAQPGATWPLPSYFQRNTWRFLCENRHCGTPHVISEYGERFSIEAPTIEAILTTEPEPVVSETQDEYNDNPELLEVLARASTSPTVHPTRQRRES